MSESSGGRESAIRAVALPETAANLWSGRPGRGVSTLRVAKALAWVWVVVLLSLGLWASYWAALRDDHYQLILLGQRVLDGGRLYVDCWENKPPGIAWINAAAMWLAGGDQLGAWIAPGVAGLLALAVTGAAVGRTFGRVAALGMLFVAAVLLTMRVHDAPSINPDFYSAVSALAAIALFMLALRVRFGVWRGVWALAAGLVWSGATGIKQTGPVGLVVMTLVGAVWYVAGRPNRRVWAVSLWWSWLGLGLGLAGIVAAMYFRGLLSEAYRAVFVFNARYFRGEDWYRALADWPRADEALAPIQFAVWLALLGFVAALGGRRMGRLGRPLAVGLLLWWLAEVLLALVGPSRSLRYWQATWPPTLMLTACGFRYLQTSFRRLGPGRRAGFVFVVVSAMALLVAPTWKHYKYGLAASYLEYSGEVRERDQLRELGRRLRELVPEGEPIYVQNYDSGVYLYAQRPCVSRFTYPRSPEQVAEILRVLEAGQAAAILVPQGPGRLLEKYFDDAARSRVRAVLQDYDSAGRFAGSGGYEIFLRRSR